MSMNLNTDRKKQQHDVAMDPVMPYLTTSISIQYWQLLLNELNSTTGVYKEHEKVIDTWSNLNQQSKDHLITVCKEALKRVDAHSEYGLLLTYGWMRAVDVVPIPEITDCLNAIMRMSDSLLIKKNLLAMFYYLRGCSNQNEDQHENAVQDYTQVLKLFPSYATARMNRALAHHDLGNFNLAIEEMDKGLRTDPYVRDGYYNRARSCYYAGRYADCIADCDTHLLRDPTSTDALIYRSLSFRDQQNYTQAIDDLTRAAKINPKDKAIYTHRAYIYCCITDYDNALHDYDIITELRPDDADNYHNRSIIREMRDEFIYALVDMRIANQLGKKSDTSQRLINHIKQANIDTLTQS